LRLVGEQPVEVAVHLGCVVTPLVVSCLLAQLALPAVFPGWDARTYWLVGGWIALADTAAGLLHELGHAVVALAHGRQVYRITLYGLAATGRRAASHGPHEQLLIALAGPLSHVALAAVFWLSWRLAPHDNLALRTATAFPAVTNLLLGLLNLIPLRPLDGRRVAASAVHIIAHQRGKLAGRPIELEVWPVAESADGKRPA
jgi:Zn-dependent protease